MSTVGERIRLERKKRGLEQKALAELAGISKVTLNRIEKSPDYKPHKKTVDKIADYLKVTPEYLLGETDTPHANRSISHAVPFSDDLYLLLYLERFLGFRFDFGVRREGDPPFCLSLSELRALTFGNNTCYIQDDPILVELVYVIIHPGDTRVEYKKFSLFMRMLRIELIVRFKSLDLDQHKTLQLKITPDFL